MQRKVLILSSLFFVVILAYFVLAAAGDNVKIVSLASGTNQTSITNKLFNVSLDNATDIPNPLNATFFFNVSGTWTKIGNTTASGCNVKAGASSCSILLNASGIADGVYSLNATIYNASASISVTYTANLTNGIYIDATAPQASSSNFSAPFSAGANLSTKARGSNYIINLSIFDATIGVATVYVNITNSTGVQNATFTATREGSTNNYVITGLNTSHYPDGEYNLTIYANDSLNNLNNSAVVQRVVFDNTPPSVSFTCSPNPVIEDETITCSCSATDALSGLNSSYGSGGLSYTANPSTASSGPSFSVSCTAQDKAGNSGVATTTYSVAGAGRGSSGGSSGGSSSRGTGLSPPSTSGTTSGGTSSGDNSPDTTVQGSEQGANAGSGSTAQGLGTAGKASLIITIIAVIVIVIVIMIKRKR